MSEKREKEGYIRSIHLRHNEIPAKVDVETGELIRTYEPTKKKRNPNRERFEANYRFKIYNEEGWKLLKTQTTKEELMVAYEMARLAKPFNGSLEPLSDETTITKLAEIFDVDRRKINIITKKLFDLGVYSKFEISEQNIDFIPRHKRYWVFNPFLAFNGKYIDKSFASLFKNTIYAKINR